MNPEHTHLPLGPLIIGINGLALDEPTIEQLQHPAVGGVILFARNFESPSQLGELTQAIAAIRWPRLLIAVDQEGGRVQRFRDGFTRLPALRIAGRWYERHPDRACDLAYRHGRVMAAELLGHGVDLSFAPVLDLDRGSRVIGDRAFSDDPVAVVELAAWYIAGMRDAGMRCCGKHFPGHGSVEADSHTEIVTDDRSIDEIRVDLSPFSELAPQLDSVMMAHVCYPACDDRPAGYSTRWIGDCLKSDIGYQGVIISDDLDMVGAATAGELPERLAQAFAAGCDAALVCKPESATGLLASPMALPVPASGTLERLYGRSMLTLEEQMQVPEFQAWRDTLNKLSDQD